MREVKNENFENTFFDNLEKNLSLNRKSPSGKIIPEKVELNNPKEYKNKDMWKHMLKMWFHLI